jgi:hypothetical protein
MVQEEYKHRVPPGNDLQVLQQQPPGRGLNIYEAMHWNVVARLKAGTTTVVEYIVVESRKDDKPLKVWGPGKRDEAITWTQLTARMYVEMNGGVILP